MADILYLIFLYPFEQFFYFILNALLKIFQPGLSLIGLSIAVNCIYIPISMLAKKIENKEREKQEAVRKEVKELKTRYKGEELFRKTETVYKKYNYSVFLSFRSNLSLLVMIPFFVAAVTTLNANPVFMDTGFLCIGDLSKQDSLLFGINILPVIMTAVNIVSIKLANPKEPLLAKGNIKLIVLALLFLAFLYNKSAALLIYWTCNNIIFLIRAGISAAIKK